MQERFQEASGRFEGLLTTPESPEYDRVRAAWNLMYAHEPAVAIEARSTRDVVEAVNLASSIGGGVAVQATGHGFASRAGEDTVLIATSRLDTVEIDAEARTARIGAGAQWGPVLAAAQEHDLAPLLGSSLTVGALGYTLGGGFGWLGRKHGLAADEVRSFTVVLADGSVVTASDDSNPDLFWALRGGGHGSLGVVVGMEIGLVEVSTVYGGNLMYPIEMATEVFERYAAWSPELPDEFTTAFTIMSFPPFEDIPEPMRGKSFAIVRGCHCGDLAEAAAMIDAWRDWREPALDLFGEMPFRDAAAISQDPVDPVPAMSSARWLTGIDEEVGEAILEASVGGSAPSPVIIAETRHAGGAISRPAADTAHPNRSADRLLQIVALTATPEAVADTEARLDRLWERLDEKVVAPYLNFLEGDERVESGRKAFDAPTWERLMAVKKTYDPTGMFRHGLRLV